MTLVLHRLLGRVRARAERGSALVEFVFLAVLMMVPLVYLVMVLARLQAGSYAATAAVREAGRAFVSATSDEQAASRAQTAARIALEDQGFRDDATIRWSCDGDPCLRPEGRVTFQADVSVPLPLVPAFARGVVPLEIPVRATHLAVVDRFRGAP